MSTDDAGPVLLFRGTGAHRDLRPTALGQQALPSATLQPEDRVIEAGRVEGETLVQWSNGRERMVCPTIVQVLADNRPCPQVKAVTTNGQPASTL